MRALVQRVNHATVRVDNEIVGAIKQGILVLLGIHRDDQPEETSWLVNKIINLRIFRDNEQKMNRSVKDVAGGILVISQFTLYGTCHKGRRPEFTQAAGGPEAEQLYEKFVREMGQEISNTAAGRFGAYMQVELENDGPVTLLVEKPNSCR